MRIVVIGGTGLVGSKVLNALTDHGHHAVAAAPSTGVDTVTGRGLPDVLTGAAVVVDVSNSPSLDETAATEFFRRSTTNLLAAEVDAGVGHHVVLSVVGTDRLARQSGYFRAKLLQEELVGGGPTPHLDRSRHAVLRVPGEHRRLRDGGRHRAAAGTLIQPMASADVARAVAIAATNDPTNANSEVGGPGSSGFPN